MPQWQMLCISRFLLTLKRRTRPQSWLDTWCAAPSVAWICHQERQSALTPASSQRIETENASTVMSEFRIFSVFFRNDDPFYGWFHEYYLLKQRNKCGIYNQYLMLMFTCHVYKPLNITSHQSWCYRQLIIRRIAIFILGWLFSSNFYS